METGQKTISLCPQHCNTLSFKYLIMFIFKRLNEINVQNVFICKDDLRLIQMLCFYYCHHQRLIFDHIMLPYT